MNFKLLITLSLILADRTDASPLMNLDFESANTNNVILDPYAPYGTTADLLPYWSFYHGDRELMAAGINHAPPDMDFDSLFTKDNLPASVSKYLTGNYSLMLSPYIEPYYLRQEGQVPADALVLTVQGWHTRDAYLKVSLNDDVLSPVYTFVGAPYPYASPLNVSWDVSAYAGQNVELELEVGISLIGLGADARVGLDTILFTVPEPNPRWLMPLGLLALWPWMRSRR